MLGAIIGDIVGSRFEFNNTDRYDFELFTPESSYTDDTICTIAIADAITEGESYEKSLLRWCRSYPNPMGGYGGRFAQWLQSESPQPYYSFGNGSAMRVAPVAWAFMRYGLLRVKAEARKSAAVTHNHPEGIKGAEAVAHAIYSQRNGFNAKELEAVGNLYYPGFMETEYTAGLFDETCQGAVPVCFKILLDSTDFEDAIRKAVSWGGDSDTIGAIVGSIAELSFGIPEEISSKALTYLPNELSSTTLRFYNKLERQTK